MPDGDCWSSVGAGDHKSGVQCQADGSDDGDDEEDVSGTREPVRKMERRWEQKKVSGCMIC